jgi:hypothetical protein
VLVPCIHVLTEPREVYPLDPAVLGQSMAHGEGVTRDEVIDYLAGLLPSHPEKGPDRIAAELLLLALIARVTSKAPGSVPLGTLSLNFLLPRAKLTATGPTQNGTTNGTQNGAVSGTQHGANGTSNGTEKRYLAFERLVEGVGRVLPLVVPVLLSIQLLSDHPFYPRSSHVTPSAGGESLQSGLLQLAPSTVVLINEDTLEGGSLQDRGVKNLHALAETVRTQKLRYEFPYVSEDFGMETDLGFVVVGQGKTLLPVGTEGLCALPSALTFHHV